MTHELRPYQHAARAAIRGAFLRGDRRVLLVLPVGAGKTTVAADLIQRAVERGGRCLFLAHRTELIDQALARLASHGVTAGRVQAGHCQDLTAPVQVASVASLARRELAAPPTLVIIDEAHRATTAGQYDALLRRWPSAHVVGLTATPIRLDGRGLGDTFQALACGPTPAELVQLGVLCDPAVWSTPHAPSLDGIKTTAGEFNQRAVADRFAGLVGDVIDHWERHAAHLKTVVFAASVQHSRDLAAAFLARGVRAAHLDANTPPAERAAVLEHLAAGRLQVLTNYNLVSEGWDLPDCACAVLARPTQSLGLYLQMVGRVMRTAPGKAGAIVLDHAGNAQRHGLPCDTRAWSLTATRRKADDAPAVRTCLGCYAVYAPAHPACPCCGTAPPAPVVKPLKVTPGALVLMVGGKDTASWLEPYRPANGGTGTDEERARAVDAIIARALRAGRKDSRWAREQYRACFGVSARGTFREMLRLAWPDEPRPVWDRARGELVWK